MFDPTYLYLFVCWVGIESSFARSYASWEMGEWLIMGPTIITSLRATTEMISTIGFRRRYYISSEEFGADEVVNDLT